MTIDGLFRAEASKIAARERSRANHLYAEYKRVQAEADSLKADYDMALSALDRLLSFQAKINGNYQCPACWIEQNAAATMLSTPAHPKTTFFIARDAGIRSLLRIDMGQD